MKLYNLLYMALIALIFSSQPVNAQIFKSKQTQRHKKLLTDQAAYKKDSRASAIEYVVSVQTVPKTAQTPNLPKTFFSLPPDVQKELIKQLGRLDDDGKEMMDDLKKNLSDKPTAPTEDLEIIDKTEIKKQIVVGIGNKSLYPGDRIYRMDITIKTKNTDVEFTSCDAVITKYETLELGKQTQTTSLGFEGGGNIGNTVVSKNSTTTTNDAGNQQTTTSGDEKNNSGSTSNNKRTDVNTGGTESTVGVGANAKINASRSRTEEGRLRQRYVALSGNILQNGVKLYSESISGIDLAGNIIAEVSFRFINQVTADFIYKFDELYMANGNVQSVDAIKIKRKMVIYPALANNIVMDDICANGVLRAVVGGSSTIMEGDDKSVMISYEKIVPVEVNPILVSKFDVIPKRWAIKKKVGTSITGQLNIAALSGPAHGGALFFESVFEARMFMEWLKENKTEIVQHNGLLLNNKYRLSDGAGGSLSDLIDNSIVDKQ